MNDDKLIVRNSLFDNLKYTVLCFGFVIYFGIKNEFSFKDSKPIIIIIGVLMVLGGFASLYRVLNRKPKLIIEKEGIHHPKSGFIEWNDVLSIKKMIKPDRNGEIIVLIIQTRYDTKPFKLEIRSLNESFDSIKNHILKHKQFNIYEIHDLDDL